MRYDGRWRDRDPSEAPEGVDPVVRVKMPREGETKLTDLVQGEVTVANDQLDDFITQTGVSFPIVRDEGSLSQIAFPPGVGYPYPRDVVVGPDLTIHSIRNSFDVAEMEALIQRLLRE